ncbi:hypothetical protein B0T18DRAFT_394114 [Schizothecium vesticola]|uniref:DUF8212 domain-containing protein n=1 Tax=Schizothecium vesticola TaxID=314040 RepID=A0AA40ELF7_9PEZI|nr:hypothetical protein B0T18DRAFT_394114 [Schizothecium vesticola]
MRIWAQHPPQRTLTLLRYDAAVLENSPWFRRGWTLQELVAPQCVEFYGTKWLYLGNKHTLCERLSNITRIPRLLLRNPRALRPYSIAQRMSWAGGRNTTRIEDKAYSLLGIVDVNMPLLYGEGINAFIRLQEEIIKVSTDESLFAWSGHFHRDQLRLSMLAPDPDAFTPAANIVPLSAHGASSYAVTNRGLEIHLRLLPSDRPDDRIGVLHCHVEDDFSGYVGLHLMFLGTDTSGVPHYMRTETCKVSEEHATEATDSFIFLRNREDTTLVYRKLYLQINDNLNAKPRKPPFTLTPLRITSLPDSDMEWPSYTRVLRIESGGWIPVYVKLGFYVEREGLGNGLLVCLYLPWGSPDSTACLNAVPSTEPEMHATWSHWINWMAAHWRWGTAPKDVAKGECAMFAGKWAIQCALRRQILTDFMILGIRLVTVARTRLQTPPPSRESFITKTQSSLFISPFRVVASAESTRSVSDNSLMVPINEAYNPNEIPTYVRYDGPRAVLGAAADNSHANAPALVLPFTTSGPRHRNDATPGADTDPSAPAQGRGSGSTSREGAPAALREEG